MANVMLFIIRIGLKNRKRVMEKEINIAELLKDCPAGTKLYTPLIGEVELIGIKEDYFESNKRCIWVKSLNNNTILPFSLTGHIILFKGDEDGEVLLFPSKENRSWEGFGKNKPQDTKEGCFKVGDIVYTPGNNVGYITEISEMAVTVSNFFDYMGKFNDNQLRFASDEEIDKWNKKLHLSGNHYSKSKKKIIDWFNPFDKVLVRDEDNELWDCSLFSYYTKNQVHPYFCLGVYYAHCIPYNEKTAHLIGTFDEYKEDGK